MLQKELIDFDKAIGKDAFSYKNKLLYLPDLHKIGLKYKKQNVEKNKKVKLTIYNTYDEELFIIIFDKKYIFQNMVKRELVTESLKENGVIL